jgi:hypothetical protein
MTETLTEDSAFVIYQGLLDEISDAYFAGDLDAYLHVVHVPHEYSTDSAAHCINDASQMEAVFDSFRGYLEGIGVTDYLRSCTGAAPISNTKILGGHTTELLRNGARLRDPYEVWSTLELIDGVWKMTGSQNAISDTSWQAHAFRQGVEMKTTDPR